MKFEEMKTMSKEQLEDKIEDWNQELFKLNVAKDLEKKAEKPHMFSLLKKQIARAKTLMRQKNSEGES